MKIEPHPKCLLAKVISAFSLVTCASADLTVDPTFNPVIGGAVYKIRLDAESRVLAAGRFAGGSSEAIVRFSFQGQRDSSFTVGAGADGRILDILPDPDGSIFIAGWFDSFSGVTAPDIVKLRPDGSVDTRFSLGMGTSGWVDSLALTQDGTLILGGNFSNFSSESIYYLAGCRRDSGARVPSFASPFNRSMAIEAGVDALGIQPDGKIIVGGIFNLATGHAKLVRLNADGSLDASFSGNHGPLVYTKSIVVQPDGKILVSGLADPSNIGFVRRLHCNGEVDENFSAPSFYGAVDSIVVQADGSILAAGGLASQNPFGIVHLNADGSVKATISADGVVRTLAGGEGKIFAGGNFSVIGGMTRPGLALLNSSNQEPQFESMSSSEGVFRVMLKATVGVLYKIEASSDLVQWEEFATASATAEGLEVRDPSSKANSKRFFRARRVAP